ncbi:18227_t:CDS:10 [Funneliformis geosporum]|nr:18227_t:CDS:10 [Funneliformis geosporum]
MSCSDLEYRSVNGEGNKKDEPLIGTPNTPFVRNFPSVPNFADENYNLIPTPGNYKAIGTGAPTCNAKLPLGTFPLPRCVSNKVMSMQLSDDDMFDITRLDKFKSKRKISHILTYWGFFVKMDVSSGLDKGEIYPTGIVIPKDDISYISSYRNGPKPANFTFATETLPFNRSKLEGGYTGINEATSFIDASTIYGNNEIDLQRVRDYGNNGKMRLEKLPGDEFGFPFVEENGRYILGYSADFRIIFTDLFHVIFLREHNRLCDEFFAIHGNDWSDEQYFQEARRWVIAFIQKITYYEYLGTALGIPLPKYEGYKPDLKPVIDTFFATVTYRYGEPITKLALNDVQSTELLKIFGVPSIALSLALERQEEVDIYFSDFISVERIDIARDRGIPLYNDARAAFGLPKKTSWADISSDPDVQKRLEDTYGTVDRVEALMGGLAEDHINGGNYGELFYKSFSEQWLNIRDSDRFWYENKDAGFSQEDIAKIKTTTLLDILIRNTPKSSLYPQNLWFVQPPTSLKIPEDNADYKDALPLADGFIIQWKIDGSDITFLITMSSTNSWFGIGFNPEGDAMSGTDMMIFQNQKKENSNEITVIGKNYKGIGLAIKPKELPEDDQILSLLGATRVVDGMTQVEVKRPLIAKNRKSIDGTIQMVYAWNPNSNEITYHGGNRDKREINFRSGISSNADGRMKILMMHGIVMFIIWGVLLPCSVWIVRYLRHINSYMVQHRNLNLFGGMMVGIFAAVAMSVTPSHAKSPHAIIGIIIFTITIIQISLGMMAIWGLANVESAATGIVRNLKHLHFYLGGALLLAAWINIFFGLSVYGANKAFIWAYIVWLVFIGFAITASEFYYKIKNMQFLWPVRFTEDSTKRIQNCIPEEVFESLPVITWDEFNNRVMTGANLVIAEGLVFDIHRWIPVHPGGQRILRRVVGTDITQDFFFDPTDQIVISTDIKVEYSDVQQPNISDNTYNERSKYDSKKKKKRPHSIANAIDMVNAKTYKDRRVAMHRHSKFATSKLASMVIARLSNSAITDTIKQNPMRSFEINNEKITQPLSSSQIFRRYILINIELVTRHNAANPVKKFTFQVIHQKDKLPRFLPGDYIEIMSFTNNQVITRLYTPIQGPTDNSFCILVKIYKDGIMSQHLNKQLKNFEIKVRGPFDIANRMVLPILETNILTRPSSPSLGETNKNLSIYDLRKSHSIATYLQQNGIVNTLYNSDVDNNNLLEGRSGILLNKEREDLCWDYLFMVCCGTGIAPMLQLIQYHMEKAASSGSDFKLFLLIANGTIADLIYPKYLDYICQILKGKLNITYVLSKPPQIWKGLCGTIDDTKLYNWMSQNYSPTITPRINNFNGENSIQDSSPKYEKFEERDQLARNSQQMAYNKRASSPLSISSSQTNEMNERQNYIRLFTMDNSKRVKVIICGTDQFNESIKKSLERLGFPIDEKALFMN